MTPTLSQYPTSSAPVLGVLEGEVRKERICKMYSVRESLSRDALIEIGGLLMKSDFPTMTMGELKKYVLENRNDQVAFQALRDRVDAQPQDQVYGEINAEQIFTLVEQHRRL